MMRTFFTLINLWALFAWSGFAEDNALDAAFGYGFGFSWGTPFSSAMTHFPVEERNRLRAEGVKLEKLFKDRTFLRAPVKQVDFYFDKKDRLDTVEILFEAKDEETWFKIMETLENEFGECTRRNTIPTLTDFATDYVCWESPTGLSLDYRLEYSLDDYDNFSAISISVWISRPEPGKSLRVPKIE